MHTFLWAGVVVGSTFPLLTCDQGIARSRGSRGGRGDVPKVRIPSIGSRIILNLSIPVVPTSEATSLKGEAGNE